MPGTVPSTLCALIYSSLNNTTSGHHFKPHFTDENLEVQSVYVTCPGQVVNSAVWWGDLAKPVCFLLGFFFFFWPHPSPSETQPWQGQGWGDAWGGRGAGAWDLAGEAARAEEVVESKDTAVLAGFRALHSRSISAGLSLGVPRRFSRLFLCIYVRRFTRLPRKPLLASLQPRRRETRTPKCRSEVGRVPAASRKPSSLPPLSRGAAGAPAVTPPRRADGASEDPGGQISLSFDRSFPSRSGFPPPLPTALPHPRGSLGSPAGSGFAWLPPPSASREGFPSAAGQLPELSGLWEELCGERDGRPGPGSSPGVLPTLPVASAWSTCLPKTSVLCSLPPLYPNQPGAGGKLVPKQISLFLFFEFKF